MNDTTNPADTAETGAAAQDTGNTPLDQALAAPDAGTTSERPAAKADTGAPAEKERNREGFGHRHALKEAQKEAAALKRELEQLREREPREAPREAPNLSDPQAIRAYLEEQRIETRLESSEDRFVDKHGQAEFDDLKAWMIGRHDLADVAIKQRNPWGYVHDLYRREKLADEIGDDPNAWRESQRQQIRAQIEAEMAESGGYQPSPGMAAQPRLPTPAAGVRSTSPRAFTGQTSLADALKRK